MKKLLVLVGLGLLSSPSFAAAVLYCSGEDGSVVTATESATSGKLFNFRVSLRAGEFKFYPKAYAAQLEVRDGSVSFLVVTDPKEGILAVVRDDTFIDKTGVYEVVKCSIEK